MTLSRGRGSRVMTIVDRESELALVARLRAGDREAFAEVHAAFNPRLFSFLARLARSRDVAEDLLEETWLRVVTHASQMSPASQLGPWLFTIARNLYCSYCRSRMLETSHAEDLLALWPAGCRQTSPFEATAASETERRVEAALASLPASYREVLLLVGVEGLTPVEAAVICGVSAVNLRQRLHRARTLLAERLEAAPAPGLSHMGEVLS